MTSNPDWDAKVAAIKAEWPTVAELFEGWPRTGPALPAVTVVNGSFCHVAGFADPRLTLLTGVSQAPDEPRIGWVLFGAAGNLQTPLPSVPRDVVKAVTNPDAVRALQFLAVDTSETDEAAIEALKHRDVVNQLTDLADSANRHCQRHDASAVLEAGVFIYGIAADRQQFAGEDVDLVCVGTPIWVAAEDR